MDSENDNLPKTHNISFVLKSVLLSNVVLTFECVNGILNCIVVVRFAMLCNVVIGFEPANAHDEILTC